MTNIRNRAIAFGLAGALALGVSATASAGPMPVGNAGLRSATTDHVTEVRWRGRGYGPGIGFGLAASALLGAAVAGSAYGPGYYYAEPGYGPGYGAPVYAQPYGYEPVYPAQQYYRPGYSGYGQCTTDEGYGRRRSCSSQ